MSAAVAWKRTPNGYELHAESVGCARWSRRRLVETAKNTRLPRCDECCAMTDTEPGAGVPKPPGWKPDGQLAAELRAAEASIPAEGTLRFAEDGVA